jgi:FAD/FMN-containing dehydrogenase
MKYLERQYGPGATVMMQMIKKDLDPYNIMNPGKVVNIMNPSRVVPP